MTNTDLIRFEALAQHYRSEADICLEMAEQTDGAHRKKAFQRPLPDDALRVVMRGADNANAVRARAGPRRLLLVRSNPLNAPNGVGRAAPERRACGVDAPLEGGKNSAGSMLTFCTPLICYGQCAVWLYDK